MRGGHGDQQFGQSCLITSAANDDHLSKFRAAGRNCRCGKLLSAAGSALGRTVCKIHEQGENCCISDTLSGSPIAQTVAVTSANHDHSPGVNRAEGIEH